VASIAWSLWQ